MCIVYSYTKRKRLTLTQSTLFVFVCWFVGICLQLFDQKKPQAIIQFVYKNQHHCFILNALFVYICICISKTRWFMRSPKQPARVIRIKTQHRSTNNVSLVQPPYSPLLPLSLPHFIVYPRHTQWHVKFTQEYFRYRTNTSPKVCYLLFLLGLTLRKCAPS